MIAKISDSLRYTGVDDAGLDLFESQYPVPAGISYNSYLILDEKVAVMDTADARMGGEWLRNLEGALDGREPDYLVVHHMEPDHSAMIAALMDRYPGLKVVAGAIALKMLPAFFDGIGLEGRTVAVEEGDVLDLGKHRLRFIAAPMIHWPEVMMSYDESEKLLFSADAFGTFGIIGESSSLLRSSCSGWTDEARRYYFNICGKYGPQVSKLLGKAGELEIAAICSLHGPVLTGPAIAEAVGLYGTWSGYEAESDGIMLAYASIHGGTAEAARTLAGMLGEKGAEELHLVDLSRCDMSRAVSDAFRYRTLVCAASSYDAGLFPPMHDFLWHLQIKNWQKRRVAVIENGSWSPTAGRVMTQMLSSMKDVEFVAEKLTIRSRMHASDMDALEALAAALLA